MNNQGYTKCVDTGTYPVDPRVPFDPSFIDRRGEIRNLLLTPITSVAQITSRQGSVRANHYHKTDWHYAYVASGSVLYFERAVGSHEIRDPRLFKQGEMFFTPPNMEHAMLFPEDTTIFTFAKNVRTHECHESDLVRVEYITPEIAEKYLR